MEQLLTPSPSLSSSSPLFIVNSGEEELTSLTNGQTNCHIELVKFHPMSYTSLRDLISSSSSSSIGTQSSYEIPIKNRLVKQAAWAYLQPMVTSPQPSEGCLMGCVGDCVRNQVDGCFGFFNTSVLPMIKGVFNGVFGNGKMEEKEH